MEEEIIALQKLSPAAQVAGIIVLGAISIAVIWGLVQFYKLIFRG